MTTASASGRRGDREGTKPRQRADGRWQIDIRYLSEGLSKRASVYGRTQGEARQKARILRKRLEAGQPARDAKVTLDGFTLEWIDTALAASERKLNTKVMYAGVARTHITGSKLGSTSLARFFPVTSKDGWWSCGPRGLRTRRSVRPTPFSARSLTPRCVTARSRSTPRSPSSGPGSQRRRRRTCRRLRCANCWKHPHRPGTPRCLPCSSTRACGGVKRSRWGGTMLTLARVCSACVARSTRVGGCLTVTEPKTAKSKRAVPLSDARNRCFRGAPGEPARGTPSGGIGVAPDRLCVHHKIRGSLRPSERSPGTEGSLKARGPARDWVAHSPPLGGLGDAVQRRTAQGGLRCARPCRNRHHWRHLRPCVPGRVAKCVLRPRRCAR